MAYRFKPSRAQKDAFIAEMAQLEAWVEGEGRAFHAKKALTGSVYFSISGQHYRVASHKPGVNFDGETCFHAAPTRAPMIAAAIVAGKKLNGRGFEA